MDDPTDPRHRASSRSQKFGAAPEKGIKKNAKKSPARTKLRVSYRSARYPVTGCTIKERNLTIPVSNPTWARVRESLSTNAGSKGVKKEE